MAKKQSNSKKKSPANYSKMKAVGFLKFIALIFPLLTYVIITTFVFPAPNSGFIFLGIIGSFIFGFGLVDIVGYLDNLNLGIQVSGFAFGLGGIMTGISSVIMYIPAIYATIDEQQVSYYFLFFYLGGYPSFDYLIHILSRCHEMIYALSRREQISHIDSDDRGNEFLAV